MLIKPLIPFTAFKTGTTPVSATQTAASSSLRANSPNYTVARVANAGPNKVFITFTVGAETASVTTSMPILPGEIELFTKGPSDTVNHICATGETASFWVTYGEGQ